MRNQTFIADENGYVDWYQSASIGDQAVYYSYAINERGSKLLPDAKKSDPDLRAVANRVLLDSGMHPNKNAPRIALVHPLQQRIDGLNKYLVIKGSGKVKHSIVSTLDD